MDKLSPNMVLLPDGTEIPVTKVQEPWWTKQQGSGYVPLSLAAPDMDQPRKYINPDRLEELNGSVAARGVRESITVTPRHLAPWSRVLPEHKDAFFVIVSGHRRWNAALKAKLLAIPITVKIYASEKEHRMDASLLNKAREALSELEEGFEAVHLQQSGWKLNQIATYFGFTNPQQVIGRMHLTNLHPSIQALIEPQLQEKRRLPITTAQVLGGLPQPTADEVQTLQDEYTDVVNKHGARVHDCYTLSEEELRFTLQKTLLAVILERKLTSVRSVEFIRERTVSFESSHNRFKGKSDRHRPSRRKDILSTFVTQITDSVIMDWRPEEFRRIFELASREEVEKMIANMEGGVLAIQGVIHTLQKVRDGKRPTSPEVLRIMEQRNQRSSS